MAEHGLFIIGVLLGFIEIVLGIVIYTVSNELRKNRETIETKVPKDTCANYRADIASRLEKLESKVFEIPL